MKIEKVGDWLRSNINKTLVREAYIFGSLTRQLATSNDVDLLLVFNVWDVRTFHTDLRRKFQSNIGLRLDIQMFHYTQLEEISSFLKKNEGVVFQL